jgi:hypothetical protein
MDLITSLVSALGGAAVTLTAAAWLARTWIRHRLEREFASYRAELAQKAEVLKTELAIYAHEQSIGLSRIDAQRSEAILSIWKELNQWHEVFIAIAGPNEKLERNPGQAVGDYQSWSRQLMTANDQLSRRVRELAIFFDEDAYKTIARYGMAISNVTTDYYAKSFEGVTFGSPEEQAAHLRVVNVARAELRRAVANNVDELRRALVIEFRLLMKAEKAR